MFRREDSRLVAGQGRYTADWNLPDQLHAVFLRADRAHAEILKLDAARALAHPGVKAVLTGADVKAAGFNSLPNIVSYPGKGGQQIKKPHHPVLALERVRYVGEPVAMIVADTAAAAEDARELVEIEYRDLPAVASFDAAVAAGAPQLHADVPGNLAFVYDSGDEQAVAAAFARAKHVTKITMDSQRLIGNAMEPRACLVAYDAAGDRYTIYAPLQGSGLSVQIAAVAGIDKSKVAMATQDVGGSFGVRGPAYHEYFAGMIAAKKLGRPVKWVGTRGEVFVSDFHGRAITLTGALAMDADGKFLAIRFDDRCDLGAYGGAFGAFIATRNITITMGGVYRVPALYGCTHLAYTNTVPVSAYRGAGRPDIAYAIERLVDHAAREHGFDPIELRRKNFIPPDAMPYKTPNAGTYDSGDFEAVMDDAMKRADWNGFPKRKAEAARAGKLLGIGIATYLEAGGGGAAPKDQVAVEFDAAGGSMTLYAVTQSSGQGHETVFPQIVAERLGVDPAHIRFHPRPPEADLVGNGTGGSRGALGTGSAFHVLGDKLIELAQPHAAKKLGAPQGELRYSEGKFHAGDRSIGFMELARALAGTRPHPLDTTAEGTYGTSYPNGCHIAEVEIEPETGAASVARYTAVDDLGNVVNPVLVEGQVHGGVIQGAGQVFCEHAVYDPATAQLLSGSFMDYVMPRAGLIRTMAVHDHPVPTPTNVLGAKGVGESGCSGSLPTLVNATIDALRPLGITHLDMPFTPARIWTAIQEHKK